jgi:hypothetical protein
MPYPAVPAIHSEGKPFPVQLVFISALYAGFVEMLVHFLQTASAHTQAMSM